MLDHFHEGFRNIGIYHSDFDWAPVVASVIATLGLLFGYLITASKNREHEVWKGKLEAYTDFIEVLYSSQPVDSGTTLQDNDTIKRLNIALAVLTLRAPPSVTREINANAKTQSLNSAGMKKICSILNNDIYPGGVGLKNEDIPWFPYNTRT